MSFKHRFRKILLLLFLGMGIVVGAPITPKQIEELMQNMNRQEIVHVIPDEKQER